jgi:hypothetical protein
VIVNDTLEHRADRRAGSVHDLRPWPRWLVAGTFVWTSGIHVGIAAAGPDAYRSFADQAVVPWVRTGWEQVFMAAPSGWGLALALGELGLGLLLFRGGAAARVGWVGVITFHVLLVLFGWGFLLWSGPVLVFLVWAAVRDWPGLAVPGRD